MFVAYWRGRSFKLGRTPTKCLVQFRFLPFPRPLGESIFDSNMNLSGCAVSEVLTTPHLPGGEQDTAIPSDLHCLWKVRGHFFLCIFVGPPFLRKKKGGHTMRTWGRSAGEKHLLGWSCNLLTSLLKRWPEISLWKPFSDFTPWLSRHRCLCL